MENTVKGILQIASNGAGLLRQEKNRFFASKEDPFLSDKMIKSMSLPEGYKLECEVIPGRPGQAPTVTKILKIEDLAVAEFKPGQPFDKIISVNPYEHLRLETTPDNITNRVVDLVSPLGKGQRAMIVSPPRAGKTTMLKNLAEGVAKNNPECYLMFLLIDERPEEVTDIRRSVTGDVFASSYDQLGNDHTQLANLIFERAKRLMEIGRDVVMFLDSLTRLARTFNLTSENSGRTLSGGLDSRAMEKPKRCFGAARKAENGGSLTIVATALINTGSRMDQLIFEEFKGTGNTEIVLDRALSEKMLWPSIDINKSGTRKDENILSKETHRLVVNMRRALASLPKEEALKVLLKNLEDTPSNAEYLKRYDTMR